MIYLWIGIGYALSHVERSDMRRPVLMVLGLAGHVAGWPLIFVADVFFGFSKINHE